MTPRAGQSLGGRPVTETVTPVNVGNQPHCDNGEGVATASPLPSRMTIAGSSLLGISAEYRFSPQSGRLKVTKLSSVVRFTDLQYGCRDIPTNKSVGYFHSSASAEFSVLPASVLLSVRRQ